MNILCHIAAQPLTAQCSHLMLNDLKCLFISKRRDVQRTPKRSTKEVRNTCYLSLTPLSKSPGELGGVKAPRSSLGIGLAMTTDLK
jgi:hypothetical protein